MNRSLLGRYKGICIPVRGNDAQKAGLKKHNVFKAIQRFVSMVASSAEEGKEGGLRRAQIRTGTECHAHPHGPHLVS